MQHRRDIHILGQALPQGLFYGGYPLTMLQGSYRVEPMEVWIVGLWITVKSPPPCGVVW